MTAGDGAAWTLPGYVVEALIGSGGSAEVWRGRELATGEPVALKRLRAGTDADAVDALRREAEVLGTLDTPYVVRLREVLGEDDDPVLVLDLADGGSLTALLARRGALDPGEVVTVAAPLAAALAVAHAAGVVHGDVSPGNVLFTAEGKPLLADLGLARLADQGPSWSGGTAEYLEPAVAAGAEPTAASDVWALAALCHHLLAGSPPHGGEGVGDVLTAAAEGGRAPLGLLAPTAPRALVDAVEAGLRPEAAGRPDAAGFAHLLRQAHAPAPVRFDGLPAAGDVPPVRETHAVPRHAVPAPARDSARRPPRWLLPVLAGIVLLVAAAGLGWQLGRAADPTAVAAALPVTGPADPPGGGKGEPTPDPAAVAPSAPEWRAELERLDAARAEAFAAADPAALAAVYAPGSPGLASDRSLVEQLAASGRTAPGVRHEVRAVEPVEVGAGRARLRVVDVLDGYEVLGPDGAVVARAAARGEAGFVVELVRTASGWRLVEVAPAEP